MLFDDHRIVPARAAVIAMFAAVSLTYAGNFSQTNLVSDLPGVAAVTDAQLKNPWGMSFSPTSPFWISDAGTGVTTLYTGTGAKQGLVVTTPPFGPTGQVFNSTTGFPSTNGSPATFLFATLGGTIDTWNGGNGTTASVAATGPGAVYTGLALGTSATGNTLYATDFKGNKIDAYNSSFAAATLTGHFTDPTIPAGYAPYNAALINGSVYVAYAKVDPATGRAAVGVGLGYVSVFDTNGNFVRRFASNGPLDAPWGMTLAPASFGEFGGDLLVGNFGDGRINAYNPVTGALVGTIANSLGVPIANPGLWGIAFRTGGAGVSTSSLYFAAGINGEADGLFGSIDPTPEPGTWMTGAGIMIVMYGLRRRFARKLS